METFIGDTVQIILDTGIDISGFTSFIMKYRRPDGSSGIWVAEIDPTNVKRMIYLTLQDDLNQSGMWAVQAHVELNGTMLHGKWVNFTVYVPLAEPHNYIMDSKVGKVGTSDSLTQLVH
jgi:hypothetical protein